METKHSVRVEVPYWPSATNNLSWSADNLIAVGGGDSLGFLVPRLMTKASPNSLQWDNITHIVNWFTVEEVPPPAPLGFDRWSVGEELSLRHITGLEWSSPGLAKFGSCALAVLHSHSVLTLWECKGRPLTKDDWSRCLIVNHAIRDYYAGLYPSVSTQDRYKQQVRQRVRTFTWMPRLWKAHDSSFGGLDRHLARGTHHMAVATEAGDILILRVESPHDILDLDTTAWGVSVVQYLQTTGKHAETLSNGTSAHAGGPSVADAIACSDIDEDGSVRLAYMTKGRLMVNALTADYSTGSSEFLVGDPMELAIPTAPSFTGPLKFVAGTCLLLLFGADQVLCVDVSRASATETPYTSHHLDGRWDEISGVAFTPGSLGQPSVHLASHMSSTFSETARLPISLDDDPDTPEPDWLYTIQETKANFSASYDLAGNVQERTWGLASSPLGDFMATCISLLPSNSPAHVIPANQWSTVAITADWWKRGSSLPANGGRSVPQDLSSESLVYSLRHYLAQDEPKGVEHDLGSVVHELLSTIGLHGIDLDAVGSTPGPQVNGTARPEDFEPFLRYIRAQIYYYSAMLTQRLERLVGLAVQKQPELTFMRETYQHLIKVVSGLPPELSAASLLSQKILEMYREVQIKLDASDTAADPALSSFNETCSICSEHVKLESLKWSRCARGHQFQRCSLTFLSMLKPGTSKSCRICSAQYINEHAITDLKSDQERNPDGMQGVEVVIGQENGASDRRTAQTEPRFSLARLLFAACDRCVFCGGKFVA